MSAATIPAPPTLLEDLAELLGWLVGLLLRLVRHAEHGRHEPGGGHVLFVVRAAFGADDRYAEVDLPGLRAPSAEDTAVLPVVAEDYLFCRRPPVLSAVDVAFRAGGARCQS